jgi:EmrB/QacA subfamily drug resistance transporter
VRDQGSAPMTRDARDRTIGGMSSPSTPNIPSAVYERRWKTLGVLSLALLIIGLDNTILSVALPSVQEQLDADSSQLQWINDSYLLVFAGLLLSFGVFGDRFGRKLALQAGTAIFGLASLCVLLVDTPDQLIAVRSVMGAGGALIMPATLSIISNVFPREERGKAIAAWSAAASVGTGLGPLFGGLLLEWFDWQAVFLLNVPVCVVAFALAIRLVPDSRDPEPGRFDVPGVTLSAASLLFLVYGIIEAPERGWLDPFTLGCTGVASALGLAFLWWEQRTPEPMLDLRLFRRARFALGAVAISLACFSLLGAMFSLTQFLQSALGYSALEAGAAMTPIALGMVLGAGSGRVLEQRLGTAKVVAGGLTVLGFTLLSALAWSPSMPYWPIAVWFLVLAVSVGWIMAPATNAVMGAVPESKAGVGSAMNDVTRQVASALGVAVIGSLTTSLYTSTMEDETAGLPAESAAVAQDSVGGAVAVADGMPGDSGASLADRAADAFTDAMALGLVGAAVVSFVGALLVIRFMPARDDAPQLRVVPPQAPAVDGTAPAAA